MARPRPSLPLVVGVLVGALLPSLYLVQLAINRSTNKQQWLEGELQVRVQGQEPLTLAIHMRDTDNADRLEFEGTAQLRGAVYPWDPVPFESTLRIHLGPDLVQMPPPFQTTDAFVVSYTERVTNRRDGLGLPLLPCQGVVSKREGRYTGEGHALADWKKLELAVDLHCFSAGPDLLWDSGDEQVWTLSGPLVQRSRPH